MGIYFNPTNDKFAMALNSQIYVDKSSLIQVTNSVMRTENRYLCVSRPRRFGKSMAANMLVAYYSRGCRSKELFEGLKLSGSEDFLTYLNKYDVISINMQEFLSRTKNVEQMLELLKKRVLWELLREYTDVGVFDETDLIGTMQDIYENTKIPFVIVIDEWDCVLREYRDNFDVQRMYLDFLRDFLKDKGHIHLAYMTGILPIKKYGSHSALNMFREYSMLDAGILAEYVGFTEPEVEELCKKYNIDMEELKNWYDGYYLKEVGEIYNPQSVVFSIQSNKFNNYWSRTETYEALKIYIDMNFDGLRDNILSLMEGGRVKVNTGSFLNDMTTFATKDDVLTLLIHLGYLGYDFDQQEVFIPNSEILNEFANAVRTADWGEVTRALELSQDTLQAIWDKDSGKVAKAIQESHLETSYFQYNDENALSYTISLALYAARNYYTVYRELPAGKGRADIAYVPRRRFSEKPALLVELKWNKTKESAIEQIKEKEYIKGLGDYKGKVLFVGVNYDKDSKEHQCLIEEYEWC